jgi:GT2 family glycosyltransferase
VDVVIPTRNGWRLTERCLRCLADQSIDHSVVVVDNGSSDGTPASVRRVSPDTHVLELGANRGFPVACNRGAAAGEGDVIVLLNNDVEPRPDFLERLVAPLLADSGVGSAAALLLQPGERTIDCVGLTVDRTLVGFPRLRGRDVADAAAVRPVLTGPSAAGGAYRRTAWTDVGGLDEGVMFYGEDVDLALRLRSAGWKTHASIDAVAVHVGSATAETRSTWQRRQSGFARGYFLRRYRALSGRDRVRTFATESIVVAGDAVLSRDLSALRGRAAGWRAARGRGAVPRPPADAVDETITFLEGLRLRRGAYGDSPRRRRTAPASAGASRRQ